MHWTSVCVCCLFVCLLACLLYESVPLRAKQPKAHHVSWGGSKGCHKWVLGYLSNICRRLWIHIFTRGPHFSSSRLTPSHSKNVTSWLCQVILMQSHCTTTTSSYYVVDSSIPLEAVSTVGTISLLTVHLLSSCTGPYARGVRLVRIYEPPPSRFCGA